MSSNPQLTDLAQPILAGDPQLNDDQRANLWDVFHTTKDSNELAQAIQTIAVPDDTKQRLFDAKKKTEVPEHPVAAAIAALAKLKEIDPTTLALAEAHPKVAGALMSAAQKTEKDAAAPAGKPAAAGKGGKAPALAQPPRADGLQHLPSIPEGHYRVQASDGGIHDIPSENIEKARDIDPRLHVLNP
jgi:hypothetical protein